MASDEMTGGWTPPACTLPAAERPLRRAEFDDLFATALCRQHRATPTQLRWELDPAQEHRARDLTARETDCCSFFVFTFISAPSAPGVLLLEVQVPPDRVDVLDALAARAAAAIGTPA